MDDLQLFPFGADSRLGLLKRPIPFVSAFWISETAGSAGEGVPRERLSLPSSSQAGCAQAVQRVGKKPGRKRSRPFTGGGAVETGERYHPSLAVRR